MDPFVIILSRWLHVVAACLALGGIVVMRVVLPIGLAAISDEASRREVFLKCRSVFKKIIHTCVLLFLLTGTYNAMLNWSAYRGNMPLTHAFFGLHVLLALIVIGLSLWATAGKEPPKAHAKAMLVNIVLLLLVVAAGSSLKYAREHPKPKATPAAATTQP